MLRQCIIICTTLVSAQRLLSNFCLLTFVFSQWSALYRDATDQWDFTFNLMALDLNIKVLDLHLAVADPRLEVMDLN